MRAPADIVRDRARVVLAAATADDAGFVASAKAMVAHTIQEYHGRFLHELIQNGYDAHPDDTRVGRIALHFVEDEGEHGVLYVANGGTPLSESNFARMSTLGRSDKTIGQGIGNKGVGFKSIFQICDAPEVYSALDEHDLGFNGFTFRFGVFEDLVDAQNGSLECATDVAERLSLSLLTVPLAAAPSTVADFRAQGYVTVLRLPARTAKAATDIAEAIRRLLDSTAPILLFLERLQLLSVRISGESHELTRVENQATETSATIVLDGLHTYRIFRRVVPLSRLEPVLHAAVEAEALDERWLDWDEPPVVSLALSADVVETPRVFTYLPMGERTASPLAGHINAPFVTNYSRQDLDSEHPVNRLFLDVVAEICMDVALELAADDGDANAVVDLISWQGHDASILEERARSRHDRSLRELIKVPCFDRTWVPLNEVYDWRFVDCQVVTSDAIRRVSDVRLLDRSRLDVNRLGLLAEVAARSDHTLDPEPEQIAGWVEGLAAELAKRGAPAKRWSAFYDDLPLIFDDGEALVGRRILLAADGSVVPSETRPDAGSRKKRGRAVYFSPVTAASEGDDSDGADLEIRPPASLARRLVITHPDLRWYDGPQRRPGRAFLQDAGLVRPFRTASLLGQLQQLLGSKPSEAVKRDSLSFAFRLFTLDPTKHGKELREVGLQVPTLGGGWWPAASARFGTGWQVAGASDLALLAEAGVPGTDLATMVEQLVVPPDDLATSGTAERWAAFLQLLGVSIRLPMLQLSEKRKILGRALVADTLADESAFPDMPEGVRQTWRRALPSDGNAYHPETWFFPGSAMCWFRGQDEIGDLPERVRFAYARAVIRTLPLLAPAHRTTTWSRERSGGQPTAVPTPLEAFIQQADWVPLTLAARGGRRFGAPHGSWFVEPEDNLAASYSTLVESSTRALIANLPEAAKVLTSIGMPTWSQPAHAARLIDHLAGVAVDGTLTDAGVAHFRASVRTAWAALGSNPPQLSEGLPVERLGQVEVLQDPTETVFVSSAQDQSASARLVRELGWPTVVADTAEASQLRQAADHVRDVWGSETILTADWEVEVVADGKPWEPDNEAVRLIDVFTWLPLVLGTTIRHPSPGRQPVGRNFSRVLEKLGQIRLETFDSLAISAGDSSLPLPARLRGVLPMPGAEPTLLRDTSKDLATWSGVDALVEPVLEMLDISRFSADLRLVVKGLAEFAASPLEEAPLTALAEATSTSVEQVRETERSVFGAVDSLIGKLTLVAPVIWGDEGFARFAAGAADAASRHDLEALLADLCGGDEARAADLLERATEAVDADSLRRALGIDLSAFNAALLAHAPGTAPVDNSARQSEEFAFRVRQRRVELLEWARASRLATFEAYKTQPDWPILRDLTFLHAEDRWAQTRDDVSQSETDSTIDRQMQEVFGERATSPGLVSVEKVRQVNQATLNTELPRLQRIVTAWHRKHGADPGPAWADGLVEATTAVLDSVGALDFAVLTSEHVVRWLLTIDRWPGGMPATDNLALLGLTEDDVSSVQTAEEADRVERLRARRRLTVLDQEVDLEQSMTDLLALVTGNLTREPDSLDSAYRVASLADVARGSGGGGGRGPASSSSKRPEQMSDQQRSAIGLVGELIAFHWLKAKDPSRAVDESCWKSTNVSHVFPGATGSDGLGYDFEVPRRTGSIMYEVKATSGEAGMLEIGETEVHCAQQFAGSDRWRLLVVEHALSAEPRVHLLPNPFRPVNRSLFSFAGNKVRLRFTLPGR